MRVGSREFESVGGVWFVVCECSLGVPLITRLDDSAVGGKALISQWETERNRLHISPAFHVCRYSQLCEAGDFIGVDGAINIEWGCLGTWMVVG